MDEIPPRATTGKWRFLLQGSKDTTLNQHAYGQIVHSLVLKCIVHLVLSDRLAGWLTPHDLPLESAPSRQITTPDEGGRRGRLQHRVSLSVRQTDPLVPIIRPSEGGNKQGGREGRTWHGVRVTRPPSWVSRLVRPPPHRLICTFRQNCGMILSGVGLACLGLWMWKYLSNDIGTVLEYRTTNVIALTIGT